MPRADHYAVLVTINRYPGLQDLQGPENDGDALKVWLLDPVGGDVAAENVRHVRSSDFGPMKDPYDANPTERELVRVLDAWMRKPGGWHERVGQRLYLYFAGHGFTAGSSISDPALFSAVAQHGDPAHIAGYRYAAKIANAGFFEEIVLVMDCCQDVLKASQVLEPTWSPPDRNQAANVKLLQAYGAPRGRKAFERALQPGSPARGLFSTVWTEALYTALPDSDGWVTGQTVKKQVLQVWAQRFKGETGYDPPVRLPDGDDIRLFRRASALAFAAPVNIAVDVDHLLRGVIRPYDVRGKVKLIRPSGGGASTFAGQRTAPSFLPALARGSREFSRDHDFLDDVDFRQPVPDLRLPQGLYVLTDYGDVADWAFEINAVPGESQARPERHRVARLRLPKAQDADVQAVPVNLVAADRGVDIVVFDAQLTEMGAGIGRLQLTLPPGLYKAQSKLTGASADTLFTVHSKPLDILLPPLRFSSAAPIVDTRDVHEYHLYPAKDAALKAPNVQLGTRVDGELFIFARDGQHALGLPQIGPFPWRGLHLSAIGEVLALALDQHLNTNLDAGFATVKVGLPEGSYALLLAPDDPAGEEYGLPMPIVHGWRTELYLDCRDADMADGNQRRALRLLDFAKATIQLRPMGEPTLLDDRLGRATEIARESLEVGRRCPPPVPSDAFASPMLALLSAFATLANQPQDRAAILDCLQGVPDVWRRRLPDFVLLDQWCARDRQMPFVLSALSQSETPGGIVYQMDSPRARTQVRGQARSLALVREIVALASDLRQPQPELGRTLFQLLLPVELEPFLADSAELVLELDVRSAAIPWELLDTPVDGEAVDTRPWALRSRMLRKMKLKDNQMAARADAIADDAALVIGEPFIDRPEYGPLDAALAESQAVSDLLQRAMGAGRVRSLYKERARPIINALLERPWRILHVSGHGDASAKGGVVLSGKAFLGPNEISAMRTVPELVFVNCCHLAAISGAAAKTRDFQAAGFAAGVAEQLIKIGVRCVVAAGWAVEDEPAKAFAIRFYERLLAGDSFANAVGEARDLAWRMGGNTWAAYQCYGDPDWVFTRNRQVDETQRIVGARGARIVPEAAWTLKTPPLLAATWDLWRQLGAEAGLAPELAVSIGQWRLGGSAWTWWQHPSHEAGHSRDLLRDADSLYPAHRADPALHPPWASSAWRPLADSLRRLGGRRIPFRQALRRRIVDAVSSGEWPSQGVFELADEFMLPHTYAAEIYGELYQAALALSDSIRLGKPGLMTEG
jgi:CHAT domain/Caspase domain